MTDDREARALAAMDQGVEEAEYVQRVLHRSTGKWALARRVTERSLGCIEDARATLDLHEQFHSLCGWCGVSYPCYDAARVLDRWAPK